MLCDVLEITPNELYGDLFTKKGGEKSPAPQLDTVTVKAAIMMEGIPPRVRSSIFKLIANLAGEGPLEKQSLRARPTYMRQSAKAAAHAPPPTRN